jgi:hypothetical protein
MEIFQVGQREIDGPLSALTGRLVRQFVLQLERSDYAYYVGMTLEAQWIRTVDKGPSLTQVHQIETWRRNPTPRY